MDDGWFELRAVGIDVPDEDKWDCATWPASVEDRLGLTLDTETSELLRHAWKRGYFLAWQRAHVT